MEGLTLVETKAQESVLGSIANLKETITKYITESERAKKPYLNIKEAIELTGLSKSTLHKYKMVIGYSRPGGVITFKRRDVEEFMEESYFKAPK
jgi:hypothetical protein